MKTFLFIIGISLLLLDNFYASPEKSQEIKKDKEELPKYATPRKPPTTTRTTTTATTPSTTTTEDPHLETQGTITRRRRTRVTQRKASHENDTDLATEILYYYDSTEEVTTPAPTKTTTRRTRPKDEETDSYDRIIDESYDDWYLKFRDRHNLPEPQQLPGRKKIVELEDMLYCRCARVYWPVCAQNNITYMNYCIMQCLDQDIRRYGPCINYRRSGDNFSEFLSDK